MLLSDVLDNPSVLVAPSYRIYRYTDAVYKIVHFPSPRVLVGGSEPSEEPGDDLYDAPDNHSAVCRAKRSVLELGLCNEWKYFCTFTLDPQKYNRYNLKAWYKDFSQFIRDQRKKYHVSLKYLLVPEMHVDGAWHMHGLLSDAPPLVSFRDRACRGEKLPDRLRNSEYCSWADYECRFGFNSLSRVIDPVPPLVSFRDRACRGEKLPDRLRNSEYCSWADYECRFGFNSLSRVIDPVAVSFYILKYISKAFDADALASGAHRYYASLGLARATLHGSVYGESDYLNRFCTNKYQWCETGMTAVRDGLDWTFAMDHMDGLQPLDDLPAPEAVPAFADVMDFIQDRLEGFS